MHKIYSRSKITIPNKILKIKNKRKIFILMVLIITILTSAKISYEAIIPIFETLCKDKAKSIATIISNEQATNVMKNYEYTQLFQIEKDKNENVTMVKSNIIAINEIISDVAIKIQEEIDKKGKENIEIALRRIFGNKLIIRKRSKN